MLDTSFRVYLIEVNTNPCLEAASPLLARLIPTMVEAAFKLVEVFASRRLALDPLFPPPEVLPPGKRYPPSDVLGEIKFSLVFDDTIDSQQLEAYTATRGRLEPLVDIDEAEHDSQDSAAESDSEPNANVNVTADDRHQSLAQASLHHASSPGSNPTP